MPSSFTQDFFLKLSPHKARKNKYLCFRCLFVCVEVLRPIGSCGALSVYLTTRLLGKLSPLSIVHILSPETDNCPSWISGRERMAVENISWSISTKECCRPRRRGLNLRPPGLQSDGASNWATKGGCVSGDPWKKSLGWSVRKNFFLPNKCNIEEFLPEWYFVHVQDDLNLCILCMFKDTFLLNAAHLDSGGYLPIFCNTS